MTSDRVQLPRIHIVLGLAIFLTTAAEIFYLIVWGMWLFPAGNWAGKTVWTLTCGLAMGAVIGSGTLVWAEPARHSGSALWRAAAIVALVGIYCGWLCSTIDNRFEFFGGPENSTLFIAASVLPALLGGLLYGWILYGSNGFAQRRLTKGDAG